MPTFQERLKYERNKRNLSQREFAKQFNIAPSTIASYETGARKPDLDTLKRLAAFFDVSTDYLLGESEESNPTGNTGYIGMEESEIILIGKRVSKYRRVKELSLHDLEQLTGLSFEYISNIENGKTMPSIPTLYTLAEALDISITSILADRNQVIQADDIPSELREIGVEYIVVAKELSDAKIPPDTIRELAKTLKKLTGNDSNQLE